MVNLGMVEQNIPTKKMGLITFAASLGSLFEWYDFFLSSFVAGTVWPIIFFASGNIVVLGTLRGVAHAGASGDREASVSAGHLNPTQLRIADLVTRAPDKEEEEYGPEIARIKDGRLLVERLTRTMWRGSLR